MLQFTPVFTQSVGVAPGTTTFASQPGNELSCGSCNHPVAGTTGLGVCQPGHYGPAVMLPGSAPPPMPLAGAQYWMPYADPALLRGAGIRWDLFALTLGLGFAGVLGYALYRRRK
jgi:hypothetical protein